MLGFCTLSVNLAFYPFAFDMLNVTPKGWGLLITVYYGADLFAMFIAGQMEAGSGKHSSAVFYGSIAATASIWFDLCICEGICCGFAASICRRDFHGNLRHNTCRTLPDNVRQGVHGKSRGFERYDQWHWQTDGDGGHIMYCCKIFLYRGVCFLQRLFAYICCDREYTFRKNSGPKKQPPCGSVNTAAGYGVFAFFFDLYRFLSASSVRALTF